MNDLCIPLPRIGEHQVADVEVTINGKKKKYHYRVEAFPWEPENSSTADLSEIALTELRIMHLRSLIGNYDKDWELIQIYNPSQGAKFIHVLFRQRKNQPAEK